MTRQDQDLALIRDKSVLARVDYDSRPRSAKTEYEFAREGSGLLP
jgi:hypothetical protein